LLRKSASCRPEISPNVNPALKNFSARHFVPEDKFLEELQLLLIAMLISISRQAKKTHSIKPTLDNFLNLQILNILWKM